MVELSPELSGLSQIHQAKIVVPSTDTVIEPLPATPNNLLGRDPSFIVIDELAIISWDLYESMSLALGKRENALLVSISTAPTSEESALWKLRELGLSGDDPSFYFREFSTPMHYSVDDEEGWKYANPALDDFLSRSALRSNLRTARESSFRRYRLNQITEDVGTWLEFGLWNALRSNRIIPEGSRVIASFDGSLSGDASGILISTIEEVPHVEVYGLWENPGTKDWRVPRHEVIETIKTLFESYDVVEFVADPAWWRSDIEQLGVLYPNRVIEFPWHSVSRAAPACNRTYAAIKSGRLSHDGDPNLARHLANCMVRDTPSGIVIQKSHKDSPRHIDLAVCLAMAMDRVAFHLKTPKPRRRVFVGSY
jgi:phage terminase large subunit-like protein